MDVEGSDAQVDTHGQGARFEELNDASYVETAYKQLRSALHEEKNPNFYMRCAGTHTGSRLTTYRDQNSCSERRRLPWRPQRNRAMKSC